jgi:hypothetical protein
MTNRLSLFIGISSYLTGFEVIDLAGTGMAPTYLATVEKETSSDILVPFFETTERILRTGAGDSSAINAMIAADLFPVSRYGGLAQNIIFMWYTGQWAPTVSAATNLEQVRNISPEAYVQGLVWTAADTHPPGAKQPGYGSWASPPLGAR